MKFTLALLSVVGTAAAQGVTSNISPDGSYPSGCAKDASGPMFVTVLSVKNAKRDLIGARDGACKDGNLVVTLSNGVLTDAKSRTGYIASNYQFQFDGPPQAGAIYTAGYSLCHNGSLALGPTTTFYRCQSGSFWNIYDRSWAAQCQPVQLGAVSCGASAGGSTGAGAGQFHDGQVVGTQVVTTTIVSAIADGQPQIITTAVPVPICQIGDGQVQAHTTPCASITAAPSAPASVAPVSQYSNGQIQVTPPAGASAAPPAASATASAAAPPPPAANTTLASSPKPSVSPSSKPSAPAASEAGRMHTASLVAFVVGLVGAVAFL